MSRYFVEFSYDGSDYHGLQKQPNSITIQEVIENNFEKFIGSKINLVLAGRTDAGVHAKQMYAHFDVEKDFEKGKRVWDTMKPLMTNLEQGGKFIQSIKFGVDLRDIDAGPPRSPLLPLNEKEQNDLKNIINEMNNKINLID